MPVVKLPGGALTIIQNPAEAAQAGEVMGIQQTQWAPQPAQVVQLPVQSRSLATEPKDVDVFLGELRARLSFVESEIEKRSQLTAEARRLRRLIKAATPKENAGPETS